ncbi:MAG TPA: hypothetical protein VIH01_08875 [Blastococcus sp.]
MTRPIPDPALPPERTWANLPPAPGGARIGFGEVTAEVLLTC